MMLAGKPVEVQMAIISAREFAATMPDASQLLSDEPEMERSLHFAQLAE